MTPTPRLERFLAPQPYAAMVVLRVALGSVLLFAYLARLPHLGRIYGPHGVGGFGLHERVPGISAGRSLEAPLQWLHAVPSEAVIWVLYVALLVASLAFALGYRTRVAGVIALVLHALFHARAQTATGGWALMIKPLLLFVVLAPAGRFASLDARNRSTGSVARWQGPGWQVRLVQMQLTAIYAVQWLRLDDPGWISGTVLAVPLTDRWFGRFDVDWLALTGPLRVLTWAALILELLAPLLLWTRIGRWWALGLIGLHASLELLTNIGWWQPLMISSLCVFLPVAWLAPLLEAPRQWWIGMRRNHTTPAVE